MIDVSEFTIEPEILPEGIPSVTVKLVNILKARLAALELPHLPNVVILQMNLVSPLERDYVARHSNYATLERLGISPAKVTSDSTRFGEEEALAYKAILESVDIDHMHIVTISTNRDQLEKRTTEMGEALERVFSGGRHDIARIGVGNYPVTFLNPKGSRFGSNKNPHTTNFNLLAVSVTNRALSEDALWDGVVSTDNLQAAWAKVRHSLADGALYDEIEVRLFEANLERNLGRLKAQLNCYAADVAKQDRYIAYRLPKSSISSRPLGLNSIEEQILSTAIIQKLGEKETRLRHSSHAYRLTGRPRGRETEYLYAPWFPAYTNYIREAQLEAKRHEACAILRTDHQ